MPTLFARLAESIRGHFKRRAVQRLEARVARHRDKAFQELKKYTIGVQRELLAERKAHEAEKAHSQYLEAKLHSAQSHAEALQGSLQRADDREAGLRSDVDILRNRVESLENALREEKDAKERCDRELALRQMEIEHLTLITQRDHERVRAEMQRYIATGELLTKTDELP